MKRPLTLAATAILFGTAGDVTAAAPQIVQLPSQVPSVPDKLLRIDAKGKLDPTWGSSGIATTRVRPQFVTYDGSGGVFVIDQNVAPPANHLVVTRLLANGSPDPNFGRGGGFVLGSSGVLGAQAVTVDPKGRVLVLAVSKPRGAPDDSFVVYRFTSGGLDPTFGTGGFTSVRIPSPAVTRQMGSVALGTDPHGHILVAGADDPNGHRNVFAVRINDNGSPDPSFGGGTGVALGAHSGDALETARVFGDAKGRIYLLANKSAPAFTPPVGEAVVASSAIVVFRFTTGGNPDTTFGKDGAIALEDHDTAYGALDGFVAASSTSETGHLYVGGYLGAAGAGPAALKPMVARFDETGKVDASFGSSGRVILAGVQAIHTVARVRRVTRDGSGRIMIVGAYRQGGPEGAAQGVGFVTRLTAAGVLDTTYGTSGTTSFTVQLWEPDIDPQGRAIFRAP